MKYRVDTDLCIGCGACEGSCPEVFQLVNGISTVILTPVPPEHQDAAESAEIACPASAISHEE